MKPRHGVAVFGLCLALGVALTVRGQLLGAAAEQPLEFYGYAYTKDATPQLAFLRQGARIFIAAEGDLIEDAYRLVRIGVDSAIVEDTSNQRRQTLALTTPKAHNDSAIAQPTPSVARTGNPGSGRPAARASQPTETGAAPVGVEPPNSFPQPYRRPVRRLASTE